MCYSLPPVQLKRFGAKPLWVNLTFRQTATQMTSEPSVTLINAKSICFEKANWIEADLPIEFYCERSEEVELGTTQQIKLVAGTGPG